MQCAVVLCIRQVGLTFVVDGEGPLGLPVAGGSAVHLKLLEPAGVVPVSKGAGQGGGMAGVAAAGASMGHSSQAKVIVAGVCAEGLHQVSGRRGVGRTWGAG